MKQWESIAALDLDPDYPPAHRPLGYLAATRGDWSEAVSYYDRFASYGGEEALKALKMRIRVRRRLNRGPSEIDRVLTETLALHEDDLHLATMKRPSEARNRVWRACRRSGRTDP